MRRSATFVALGIVGACRASVVDVGTPLTGVEGGVPDASVPVWAGNESNCPADRPTDGPTPCDVREGQSCAYWFTDEHGQSDYTGCTCYEQNRSSKLWDCRFIVGVHPSCPTVQPEEKTDCFGSVGLHCPFPPNTECQCPSAPTPQWTCGPDPFGSGLSLPVSTPTVSQDKRIRDLTDTELQSWCTWYGDLLQPPGHPPGVERPIDADGYARGYGAVQSGIFYAPVCMPLDIPVSYCVANMKLGPCEATVGELNDCVLTVFRRIPSPHGCGRFLEAANCADLFVRDNKGGDGGVECSSIKVR
jgi:hypothetical protein